MLRVSRRESEPSAVFQQRATGPDPHTGQVYLIDRQARLVHRTPSMPRAEVILEGLRVMARTS